MQLAIDIGNTNINFGVIARHSDLKSKAKGKNLSRVKILRSASGLPQDDKSQQPFLLKRYLVGTKTRSYLEILRKISLENDIDDVLICSVAPEALKRLEKDIRHVFRKKPIVTGRDIIVPIKNRYRFPGDVGQDRLVNAYAGIVLYGYPLVAIDFGTAITFDIISDKKEYLGGMILPGLKISLEALAQKTALLPKVKLAAPKEFIGRDTASSMLSGIVYGYSELVDGLVTQLKKTLGSTTKIIGTGGDINLLKKYCHCFDKIDPDLTLKGLAIIYNHCK